MCVCVCVCIMVIFNLKKEHGYNYGGIPFNKVKLIYLAWHVGVHMIAQGLSASAGKIAHFAFIWSYANVNIDMLLQKCKSRVLFRAQFASKRLNFQMTFSNVTANITKSHCRIAALFTFVRLDVKMRPDMHLAKKIISRIKIKK